MRPARPLVRFPLHLEREYAARLVRRLALMRRLVAEVLSTRRDNKNPDEHNEAAGVRARMRVQATERAMPALPTDFGEDTAQAVDMFTSRTIVRAVGVLGVDVEADRRIGERTRLEMRRLHVGWAREQVALIQGLERRTWTDVATAVAEAVATGRTDLAAVLRDRFGVAETRARLIARDQIGSLNARITEARQRQLGILAYEWSSSGDERVRPLHRALDGTVRRWDEPHPTEGHPGEAIQCRCVALPVVDADRVPAPTPRQPRQLPQLPATFGGPAQPPAPPPPPPPSDPPAPPPPADPPAPPPEDPPGPPKLDLSQVSLRYIESAADDDERADLVRRVVGRDATAEEIVSWAGVEQADLGPGTTIEIESVGFDLEIRIGTPRMEMARTVRRRAGRLTIKHNNFEVYTPGSGLGARVFQRAVRRLQRAGFARIDTYAAGNVREAARGGYNGYYTWPRFGYDAPLDQSTLTALPADLQGARTVQDLFETDAGMRWWRQNGGYTDMEFDLSTNSRSMQVLEDYLAEKGIPREDASDPAERAADLERARRGKVEQPDLSDDDEAAMERMWARRHAAREGRG